MFADNGRIDRLPQERREAILAQLGRDGKVIAADLARIHGVSEDTVRRDLRDMAAAGLCQRVYGGALALSPASLPPAERRGTARGSKQALGECLAALVPPGSSLFLDAGSTTLATALALPSDAGLSVATHDPVIAAALAARQGIEVVILGGRLDHQVGAALGPATLKAAAALRPDLLMLGVCAIDADHGVRAFHLQDAEMKRQLIRVSGKVIAAVTNDKLGTGAPHLVAPSRSLAGLVVEADAPNAAIEPFQRAGIPVHRAGGPTGG